MRQREARATEAAARSSAARSCQPLTATCQPLTAKQLQVDVRGLEHLGGALRLNPALRGDADAPQPPQRSDQLPVDVGEERDGLVIEGARSHSIGPRQAVSKSSS